MTDAHGEQGVREKPATSEHKKRENEPFSITVRIRNGLTKVAIATRIPSDCYGDNVHVDVIADGASKGRVTTPKNSIAIK
jgi:hypothetical protein